MNGSKRSQALVPAYNSKDVATFPGTHWPLHMWQSLWFSCPHPLNSYRIHCHELLGRPVSSCISRPDGSLAMFGLHVGRWGPQTMRQNNWWLNTCLFCPLFGGIGGTEPFTWLPVKLNPSCPHPCPLHHTPFIGSLSYLSTSPLLFCVTCDPLPNQLPEPKS